jgi:hypothetical protein
VAATLGPEHRRRENFRFKPRLGRGPRRQKATRSPHSRPREGLAKPLSLEMFAFLRVGHVLPSTRSTPGDANRDDGRGRHDDVDPRDVSVMMTGVKPAAMVIGVQPAMSRYRRRHRDDGRGPGDANQTQMVAETGAEGTQAA